MFGYERAKYLGFLDAVVDEAGTNAYLLPEGRGRPFSFGPWVCTAAMGKESEILLPKRIEKIWKTDLFYLATMIRVTLQPQSNQTMMHLKVGLA